MRVVSSAAGPWASLTTRAPHFLAGQPRVAMTLWLGDLTRPTCLARLRAPSEGSATHTQE